MKKYILIIPIVFFSIFGLAKADTLIKTIPISWNVTGNSGQTVNYSWTSDGGYINYYDLETSECGGYNIIGASTTLNGSALASSYGSVNRVDNIALNVGTSTYTFYTSGTPDVSTVYAGTNCIFTGINLYSEYDDPNISITNPVATTTPQSQVQLISHTKYHLVFLRTLNFP